MRLTQGQAVASKFFERSRDIGVVLSEHEKSWIEQCLGPHTFQDLSSCSTSEQLFRSDIFPDPDVAQPGRWEQLRYMVLAHVRVQLCKTNRGKPMHFEDPIVQQRTPSTVAAEAERVRRIMRSECHQLSLDLTGNKHFGGEDNDHAMLSALETFSKQVSQRPQVVVIGETSSGKSSFINCMLGERMLPDDFGPCTDAVCCLEGVEDTTELQIAEVCGSEIRSWLPLDGSRARPFDELTKVLRGFLNSRQSSERPPSRLFKLLVRCEDLSRVCLIDTPGLTDSHGYLIDEYRLLKRSHVLVLVLSAEDGAEPVVDALERNGTAVSKDNTVVLITKLDLAQEAVANGGDPLQVQRSLRNIFETLRRLSAFRSMDNEEMGKFVIQTNLQRDLDWIVGNGKQGTDASHTKVLSSSFLQARDKILSGLERACTVAKEKDSQLLHKIASEVLFPALERKMQKAVRKICSDQELVKQRVAVGTCGLLQRSAQLQKMTLAHEQAQFALSSATKELNDFVRRNHRIRTLCDQAKMVALQELRSRTSELNDRFRESFDRQVREFLTEEKVTGHVRFGPASKDMDVEALASLASEQMTSYIHRTLHSAASNIYDEAQTAFHIFCKEKMGETDQELRTDLKVDIDALRYLEAHAKSLKVSEAKVLVDGATLKSWERGLVSIFERGFARFFSVGNEPELGPRENARRTRDSPQEFGKALFGQWGQARLSKIKEEWSAIPKELEKAGEEFVSSLTKPVHQVLDNRLSALERGVVAANEHVQAVLQTLNVVKQGDAHFRQEMTRLIEEADVWVSISRTHRQELNSVFLKVDNFCTRCNLYKDSEALCKTREKMFTVGYELPPHQTALLYCALWSARWPVVMERDLFWGLVISVAVALVAFAWLSLSSA